MNVEVFLPFECIYKKKKVIHKFENSQSKGKIMFKQNRILIFVFTLMTAIPNIPPFNTDNIGIYFYRH